MRICVLFVSIVCVPMERRGCVDGSTVWDSSHGTSADADSRTLHPRDEAKMERLRDKYNANCGTSTQNAKCDTLAKKIDNFLARVINIYLPTRGDVRTGSEKRWVCLDYTLSVHVAWYNLDQQLCCNGLHNRTSPTQKCCMGRVYDAAEQLCCGRNLLYRIKQSQSKCCNDTVYNATKTMCCKGRLYDRDSETECCGNKRYNTSTTICCDNVTQPAYGVRNSYGRCCGKQSFNMRCYKCNQSSVVVPHFDTAAALCCDENVVWKQSTRSACCGTRVIDTTISVCQNDSTVTTDNSTVVNMTSKTPPTSLGQSRGVLPYEVMLAVVVCCVVGVAIASGVLVCRLKHCIIAGVIRKKYDVYRNGGYSTSLNMTSIPDDIYDKQNVEESTEHDRNMPEVSDSTVSETTSSSQSLCSLMESITLDLVAWEPDTAVVTINTDTLSKFEKGSCNHHGNMVTDYIVETGTQTENGNTCNSRNVFGEPFEYKSYLNASNSTFEMDWSSAKLVLPEKLLRSAEVEIHGSTFRSIPCVNTKFGIPDDEAIASPVVEYYITGYPGFTDHAVCILPFIGKPEDVCVKKFRSDEGRNYITSSDVVPEKGKYNGDSDLFYMTKDSHVYIYTRSFSGFYCTTCVKSRQLNLRAFLFGSYKKLQRFEIRMAVYIADEIFKFKDFKKRMYDIEETQGRVLKLDQPLDLLPGLTGDDLLRLYITPTGPHRHGRWTHKLHPVDDRPIKDVEKAIPLKRIVMCHNLSEVPYSIEWYLCNTGNAPPDYKFQCVVDIHCQSRCDDSAGEMTNLIVDELELRAQDLLACRGQMRYNPIRLQDIKHTFRRLDENRRQTFTAELSNRIPLGRQRENLDLVLDELQENYSDEGFMKTISSVLRELRYVEIIDMLTDQELLPLDYTTRAVQPVTRDLSSSTESRTRPIENCVGYCTEAEPLFQAHVQVVERPLQASGNLGNGTRVSNANTNTFSTNNTLERLPRRETGEQSRSIESPNFEETETLRNTHSQASLCSGFDSSLVITHAQSNDHFPVQEASPDSITEVKQNAESRDGNDDTDAAEKQTLLLRDTDASV